MYVTEPPEPELADAPVLAYNMSTGTLSWDEVTGAAGYVIRYSWNPGRNATFNVTGNSYSIDLGHFASGGTYSAEVYSVDARNSQTSKCSSAIQFDVVDITWSTGISTGNLPRLALVGVTYEYDLQYQNEDMDCLLESFVQTDGVTASIDTNNHFTYTITSSPSHSVNFDFTWKQKPVTVLGWNENNMYAQWTYGNTVTPYEITVYQDGNCCKTIGGVNSRYYDLSQLFIESGPGAYTYTVQITGDGTMLLESDISATSVPFYYMTAAPAAGNSTTPSSTTPSTVPSTTPVGTVTVQNTNTTPTDDAADGTEIPTGQLTDNARDLQYTVLTQAERDRVVNGENVSINLEIKDAVGLVDEATKALIAESLGDSFIGYYFDISLYKQIGSDAVTQVHNTDGTVTVKIKLPSGLVNTDTTVSRTYQMLRIHDGVATIIDGTYDPSTGEFTFVTDQFSIYVLIYKDIPIAGVTETPQSTTVMDSVPTTGDDNRIAGVFVLMTILTAVVGYAFWKKERNEMK